MTMQIKQVCFNQYGQPDVLRMVETTLPQLKAGEVRIRVTAIGVNYSDILRRKNTYFMPTPLPFVLGTEAVGVIEEVGEGVEMPYVAGARVLAILPQAGGYATHMVAHAQFCVPLPPAISDMEATAIFVQGSTAQLMISHLAGNLEGKTVLIQAAAGGVGNLLVQLARMQGATVIGAVGSAEKMKIATATGVQLAVNYAEPDWYQQVLDFTQGKGVDLIFEMVGGHIYNQSLKCLAQGGHIIVYGCASGVLGHIHPEHFVDHNITQSGFNLAFYIQHHMPAWQQALGTVISLLAQGKLKIETPHTFALADAAEAHKQMEARKTTGKVVLLPS